MSLRFTPDNPAGAELRRWWLDLAGRRGDRAELRRAATPAEAFIHPAAIGLIHSMRPHMPEGGNWPDRIGALAGLASHLDFNHPDRVLRLQSLGQRMAEKKGDSPIVSELRFRRLLQQPRDRLYHPMIRVLRMLDGQASLFDLATVWFYWGDRVRKDLALDYFPKVA